MIHGHKPSAYFSTSDGEGKKIEGECRQCIHCQYTWEYVPGSGVLRGYCMKCGGFLCARAECHMQQLRFLAEWERRTSQIRTCIPFEEWNSRIMEKVAHLLPLAEDVTVTPDGVIIPKY